VPASLWALIMPAMAADMTPFDSILKTGRPARHLSRSIDHSIGVAPAPRAARSREAGSFCGPQETIPTGDQPGPLTEVLRPCVRQTGDAVCTPGFDVVDGARSRHRSVIGWSS
jgi:hypothetical protein